MDDPSTVPPSFLVDELSHLSLETPVSVPSYDHNTLAMDPNTAHEIPQIPPLPFNYQEYTIDPALQVQFGEEYGEPPDDAAWASGGEVDQYNEDDQSFAGPSNLGGLPYACPKCPNKYQKQYQLS